MRVNFNWDLIAMTTREFIGDAFESIDTLATGTRTGIRMRIHVLGFLIFCRLSSILIKA